MSGTPLVSVVIPTFNYASYLARALDSVLAQSYRNLEVIVVDDGSTDHTAQLVQGYRERHPERVSYLYQENSGPNRARNRGVAAARGEFVALLDADDEWLPEKLELQMACALAHPEIALVGCGAYAVSPEGAIVSEDRCQPPPPRRELARHLKIRNFHFGGCSGVLIRKRCLDAVGPFDESLRGSEDRDMWLRLAEHYDFMNLAEPLFKFHFHHTNCHANYRVMLESRLRFIDKHFRAEPFAFRQRALSFAYLDAARESYKGARRLAAFRFSLQAVAHFPAKCCADDDKYQLMIKALLPGRLLAALRSR